MARTLINEHGYDPQKLQVLLGGWNTWNDMHTQDPKTYPIETGLGSEVTSTPAVVETPKAEETPTTQGQDTIPTPNGPQWTATAIAFATETAPLPRISTDELKSLLAANNVKIVDVRTKALYDTHHIKGATNVPQSDTFTRIKEFPKEGNLVVYCQ